MRTGILPALAVVVTVAAATACGGAEPGPAASIPTQSAPAETVAQTTAPVESTPPETDTGRTGDTVELPAAVVATREAILAAARARDYEGLEALLDPASFSYSFGESGDPAGYWRRLEEEGEVPILGDFLPLVLSWPVGRDGDVYVWPAAHLKPPEEWTDADLDALRQLYPAEELAGFEQAGGYLGYRVGIREDGTWLFFVAGD